MKNKNGWWPKFLRFYSARWSAEDYPGSEPRFYVPLFAKDAAVFVLLPIGAILLYRYITQPSQSHKAKPTQQITRDSSRLESKSQIIEFKAAGAGTGLAGIAKRSPGSLVRVKLLNVVETYSTAPVHAQVVDVGLGQSLLGGTLIGDATPDTNFERISITFRYARDPSRENVAVPMSGRALGLDGTLGLEAQKKEGFITRSAIGSAQAVSQMAGGKNSSTDLKDILFRALTAGLVEEFGAESQVEKNRGQVLTLVPGVEFFAELTDFFPGGGK